jgi:allantoicase
MDGWETARHGALTRGGEDYCIIKLGMAGKITRVDIDTNHFTGNYAQYAAIDAIHANFQDIPWFELDKHKDWVNILPKSSM